MPTPPAHIDLSEALSAARDTQALELGAGALSRIPELFRRFLQGKSALLVADPNTFRAAGQTVLDALREAGCPTLETFVYHDPELHADEQSLVDLETALKACPEAAPIAIGSGTINDLTKLAAHRANRRYLAVATAASMDGYTAFGASIACQGSKQTFPCPAPLAVVADLDVLGAAPRELQAAGYADLLAKITGGADWLLADALGVEPLHPAAWKTAQSGLRNALSESAGVRKGESAALQRLIEGLLLSGFAMQAAGSSRPASGAEHQFSHLWDMEGHTHGGKTPLHGFKVAIGSLAMAALYEYILGQPLEAVDVSRCCAQWPSEAARERRVRELFGATALGEVALRESAAKAIRPEELRVQLESLRRQWPDLRDKLRRQLLPLVELRRLLRDAGAPVEPEQIGISRERLRASCRQAYFLRHRFTVLDLAVRAVLLEDGLRHIFGPGGAWPSAGG